MHILVALDLQGTSEREESSEVGRQMRCLLTFDVAIIFPAIQVMEGVGGGIKEQKQGK